MSPRIGCDVVCRAMVFGAVRVAARPELERFSLPWLWSNAAPVELSRNCHRSLIWQLFGPWLLQCDLQEGPLFRTDTSVNLFTVYRNALWRLHSHAHLILSYAKNGNHHLVCNYDRFSGSSCQDKHV